MQPNQVPTPPNQPTVTPNTAATPAPPEEPKPDRKSLIRGIGIFLIIFAVATVIGYYLGTSHKTNNQQPATSTQIAGKTQSPASNLPGVQLDASKNYGNKYANGLLPVGDSQYTTTAAKKGYIYACGTYAQSLAASQGGAGSRGPWFVNNNTQYDLNKKLHVKGAVAWQANFSDNVAGSTRTIITNDLPNHPTGVFPISSGDPAYAYDRNPNSIKSQSFTYYLNASPNYGAPQCMGGDVGIMLTGVALFNGFDAGGRDAGAWEIQDGCSGHPQASGEYHYHSLSACIKDVSVHTVIGFALDGFPITGPLVGTNNILTTGDLDECHGLTSPIIIDGKQKTMYHYVMTQDFPYSVSCFRSTAIKPPGQQNPPAHP